MFSRRPKEAQTSAQVDRTRDTVELHDLRRNIVSMIVVDSDETDVPPMPAGTFDENKERWIRDAHLFQTVLNASLANGDDEIRAFIAQSREQERQQETGPITSGA